MARKRRQVPQEHPDSIPGRAARAREAQETQTDIILQAKREGARSVRVVAPLDPRALEAAMAEPFTTVPEATRALLEWTETFRAMDIIEKGVR